MEDGSTKFDVSQISGASFHINPQNHGLTENVMDSVIDDIHERYVNKEIEGSGWSLNSINSCVASIVATHKCGVPTGRYSVGTWTPLLNPVKVPLIGSNENGNAVTNKLPRLCPVPLYILLPGRRV